MTNTSFHGRIAWYDLMTSHPDAAIPFYRQVTGWETEAWTEGKEPYTMWTNDGQPIGGVMQLPEDALAQGASPHWLMYMAVANLDEALETIGKRDGQVLFGPHTIPSVGRIASAMDPQGGIFALLEPEAEPPGHDLPRTIGEFSWHELGTTDAEAAFEFYSALFGWVETGRMDMGEAGTYRMFGRNDVALGGIYRKTAGMPGPPPPGWLPYVRVPSAEQAASSVTERGGEVLAGPHEVPGGDRIVVCADPQGAAFALHMTGDQ